MTRDPWAHHLDHDPPTARQLRPVDLRDRSDGDRLPLEAPEGQPLREGRLECGSELPPAHRRLTGVERLKTDAHSLGQKVAARGQDLAELDAEGPGVLGEADKGVADGLPGQPPWTFA